MSHFVLCSLFSRLSPPSALASTACRSRAAPRCRCSIEPLGRQTAGDQPVARLQRGCYATWPAACCGRICSGCGPISRAQRAVGTCAHQPVGVCSRMLRTVPADSRGALGWIGPSLLLLRPARYIARVNESVSVTASRWPRQIARQVGSRSLRGFAAFLACRLRWWWRAAARPWGYAPSCRKRQQRAPRLVASGSSGSPDGMAEGVGDDLHPGGRIEQAAAAGDNPRRPAR